MSRLAVTPQFKVYRGSKERLRKKAIEHNAMAQRVADHVNKLAANNPDEIQQYTSRQLHVTSE
jgi:ATP-dependent protease ClpP protease subunit